MTEQTSPPSSEEKYLHHVSWKGIIAIVEAKTELWINPLIVCVTLAAGALIFLCCICPEKLYSNLLFVCNINLDVFPNLLGFTLGGFAVLVGFSNGDLLKRSSESEKGNYSVYQILNAIFASHLILQIATLMISYMVVWVAGLELAENMKYSSTVAVITNCCIFFVVFFCATYSMVLAVYSVVNLFTLSQVNDAFHTKKPSAK